MNTLHIVQAAFRAKDGSVYVSGPVHNIEIVPDGLEVEDGFVDSNGDFMTREEATDKLHLDHKLQSEEVDMEKREAEPYSISDPQPVGNGLLETGIHHNGKKIGHLRFYASPTHDGKHEGYHKIETAEVSALHRKKGLYGKALVHSAKYVKSKLGSKGLVSEGHWRSEAATGAWSKLARKVKGIQKVPGKEQGAPDFRLSEASFGESLEKMHPTPTFPKLGAPDDRRETPLVTRSGAALKEKLMLHSIKRRNPENAMARHNTMNAREQPKRLGLTLTSPTVDHNLSYARTEPAKMHEDLHLMFNRVRQKYGNAGAINLATNLFNHVPDESKDALRTVVSYKYGGKGPHPTQYHEEHLAHLIDYLNNPKFREKFHKDQVGHVSPLTGQLTQKGQEFQTKLKRAYQSVRQAGEKASPVWTQRILKTNRLQKADRDAQEELNKGELDVAIIPRIVKPCNNDGAETAIEVRHAFSTGSVRPITLNGKHCKGVAIAFDNVSNHTWLLKPGSGADSPAAGVREEKASQSSREVAFSKVAHLLGLGDYVPYGDLLMLDGKETAAMAFLNPTFKSFKALKHDKDFNTRYLFSKYLDMGVLYKWAALDYMLGQTDRHAGNIMVNKEGHVKLIDAGSAFAGFNYDPAHDPKSFVPFYLRVFLSNKFAKLTSEQRYSEYPKLNRVAEDDLTNWVNSIEPEVVAAILAKYGINSNPVLNRLHNLKGYNGKKSDFLNLFFSGVIRNEYRQEPVGPKQEEKDRDAEEIPGL